MSCHGINAVNPVCRIRQAATDATHDAFSNIAGWFAQAAGKATTWLWDELGSATSIDLGSPHLGTDLTVTGAIAGVLCLGLFALQVITSALRREPGGLGRAVKGLLIALVASAFALSVTKILLGVVDALSDGVVRYAMNTNMAGLGRQLQLANLTSGGLANPAALLLFSIVVLGAVVVVWAAMMIRKMMIIIAAVLTPLAFSGATADITRSWVRRWIEFMAAMIVSKLLLVLIMMVGISVVEGAGQAGGGVGQGVTQLATGSLILLMGGFAPWVAIKMFHFTGDALAGAHAYAAQAPAGAATVIAAPAKMYALHSHASTALSRGAAATHAAPAHPGTQTGDGSTGAATTDTSERARDSSDVLYDKAAQPSTDGQDGSPAAGGSGTDRTRVGGDGAAGAGSAEAGAGVPVPAPGEAAASAAGSSAGGPAGSTSAAASGAGAAAVAAPAAVAGAAHRAGTATGRATQAAAPEQVPDSPGPSAAASGADRPTRPEPPPADRGQAGAPPPSGPTRPT